MRASYDNRITTSLAVLTYTTLDYVIQRQEKAYVEISLFQNKISLGQNNKWLSEDQTNECNQPTHRDDLNAKVVASKKV